MGFLFDLEMFFDDLGDTVSGAVEDLGDTVSEKIEDFGDTVSGAVEDFGDTVSEKIHDVMNGAQEEETIKLTDKMKKMLEVIKNNDEPLRNYDDMFIRKYFAPKIPEKIVKKLVDFYDAQLPVNSLVAFYDTSLLHTCKSGVIFTSDGFYDKFVGQAVYFQYSDIRKVEVFSSLDNKSSSVKVITDLSDYELYASFGKNTFKDVILELKEIDAEYGQTFYKRTGKVGKLELPEDIQTKCHTIIHSASVACGAVGTGLAQIPASDSAVIVPIQIGMIVGLGQVFELNITESAAKSIIASAGATIAGRTASQFLVGWIPVVGNVINTATAAGLTEAIGWIAVGNFYNRWIEDRKKGRVDAMKDGYKEASGEYERKLKKQAEDFLNQKKDFEKERAEYETLIHEYEQYIREMEKNRVDTEHIDEFRNTYNRLRALPSA